MNAAAWSALFVAASVLGWPRRTSLPGPPPSSGLAPAGPRVRGRRARSRRRWAEAAVLAVLDALGAALRAGLAPDTALRHLAEVDDGAGGRLALELAEAGRAGGSCWRHIARTAGAPEVLVVAQAWELSQSAGIRLADAVDLAARLMREGRARRDRREVALAGPRATIAVLTLLPLLGPGVGLAVDIDPIELYAGTGLSMVATGAGVAMLIGGRLWAAALVRRSVRAVPPAWSAGASRRVLRHGRSRTAPVRRHTGATGSDPGAPARFGRGP